MRLFSIVILFIELFTFELNSFTQIHPPYKLLQPSPSHSIFNPLDFESDILDLNKKIIKIASKLPNKMKLNANQIHHIFLLHYNGVLKKDLFLSKQFLKYITPAYYEHKRCKNCKYLCTEALICNEEGKIIASFSGVSVIPTYIPSVTQEVVNKLINKEIDYCFSISNIRLGTYFGIKGSKVYVFSDSYDKDLSQFSLNDFINNYWDIFY